MWCQCNDQEIVAIESFTHCSLNQNQNLGPWPHLLSSPQMSKVFIFEQPFHRNKKDLLKGIVGVGFK